MPFWHTFLRSILPNVILNFNEMFNYCTTPKSECWVFLCVGGGVVKQNFPFFSMGIIFLLEIICNISVFIVLYGIRSLAYLI